MAAHKGDRVAAAVGVVAGVKAHGNSAGVGLLQKQLDLIFVFDVGFSVRMIDEVESKPFNDEIGDSVSVFDERLPPVVIQPAGAERLTVNIGIGVVDQDDKLGAEGGQRIAHAGGFFLDFRPGVSIFQVRHHKRSGDVEFPALEFRAEYGQVGRQIAVGAQFRPLVAGFGDLIQTSLPRDLLGVAGKPNTP